MKTSLAIILSLALLTATGAQAAGMDDGMKQGGMGMGNQSGGMGMGGQGMGMGMQNRFQQMNKLMEQAHNTRDAEQHYELMQQHMNEMMEGMNMMRGMGGGMGPGSGMGQGNNTGSGASDMNQRYQYMEQRMDMMQNMMDQLIRHQREDMRMRGR